MIELRRAQDNPLSTGAKWSIGVVAGVTIVGIGVYFGTRPAQTDTPKPGSTTTRTVDPIHTPITDPTLISGSQLALAMITQATQVYGPPYTPTGQNDAAYQTTLATFQKGANLPGATPGVLDAATLGSLLAGVVVLTRTPMSPPMVPAMLTSTAYPMLEALSTAGWTPGVTYKATDGSGGNYQSALSAFQTRVNASLPVPSLPTSGTLDWATWGMLYWASLGRLS